MASVQSITFESSSLDLERRAQRQLDQIERLTSNRRRSTTDQSLQENGKRQSPAIASRMDSVIKGLDSAKRNTSDAFSLLEFTNESLGEIASKVEEMVQMAKSSAVESMKASTREKLNAKFQALALEVEQSVLNSNFRGVSVFSDSASKMNIVVNPGAEKLSTINVDLTANIEINAQQIAGSLSSIFSQIRAFRSIQDPSGTVFGSLLSSFGSGIAADNSEAALKSILEIRAKSGSQMNRFYNVLDSIEQLTESTKKARAEFESTNYAKQIGEKTARMFLEFSEKSKALQANLNPTAAKALLANELDSPPVTSSTGDAKIAKPIDEVYSINIDVDRVKQDSTAS